MHMTAVAAEDQKRALCWLPGAGFEEAVSCPVRMLETEQAILSADPSVPTQPILSVQLSDFHVHVHLCSMAYISTTNP